MGRITKCICDGCGKEIEKNPIVIYTERVDAETGDFVGGYWMDGKDYCESCIRKVIEFVKNLPKSIASAPDPHSEATTKSDSKKPTIRELLVGGRQPRRSCRLPDAKKFPSTRYVIR